MQDENQLNPAERELELYLARLQPVPHGIKRDAVLFQAGQRLALRRLRRWQAVSGVLLLATVGLGWWQVRRQSGPGPVQVASAARPDQSDRSDRLDRPVPNVARAESAREQLRGVETREYLRLRTEVITRGPEVLPSPALTPSAAGAMRSVSDWRLIAAMTPAAMPGPDRR